MPQAIILDTLKKLSALPAVSICCLIKKDGDIIASVGDIGSLQIETFGIMSATIYGAATTANEELDKQLPENIVIEDDDGGTIIKAVDKQHFLVLRTDEKGEFDESIEKLEEAKKALMEEWSEMQ